MGNVMLNFNEWKLQVLTSVPANLFSEEELRVAYDNRVTTFLRCGGKKETLTLYVSIAFIGNIEGIKWALQHGCNPMKRDRYGCNFWHYVAFSAKVEALEWALQHGCDPMLKNDNGQIFWHYVAFSGNVKALEWALQHGCDPMYANDFGGPFWHWVARSGNVEALEWALQNGCDPMLKNYNGQIFWHYVALSGNVKALEWALQHGCDPMYANDFGGPFWHWVARSGNVEALEWALQNGCDPMIQDNKGRNFWYGVAISGNKNAIEWASKNDRFLKQIQISKLPSGQNFTEIRNYIKSLSALESFKSQEEPRGAGKYFYHPSTLFGASLERCQLEQSFNADKGYFFEHICQLLGGWKSQLSQQSTPPYHMMDSHSLNNLRKKNLLLQDFLIDKLSKFKSGEIQDCSEEKLNEIVINCFSRALNIFPQYPQKALGFVEHLTPQAGDMYRLLFEDLSNVVYAHLMNETNNPEIALIAAEPYHKKLLAISSQHPLSQSYLHMLAEKQKECARIRNAATDSSHKI